MHWCWVIPIELHRNWIIPENIRCDKKVKENDCEFCHVKLRLQKGMKTEDQGKWYKKNKRNVLLKETAMSVGCSGKGGLEVAWPVSALLGKELI